MRYKHHFIKFLYTYYSFFLFIFYWGKGGGADSDIQAAVGPDIKDKISYSPAIKKGARCNYHFKI